ncbi:hypothetical protein F7725_004007 [Dissostichus mawsoni]|uniref:Helicase ATP-binding domain-containing protein n=1 Tax=Dissostichus mawsoni TaxID=36200 RepID=A0A7J5YDS6_DISMA|nr:hypothetical protein F7725_004007 [Dissostichus mawsoni]
MHCGFSLFPLLRSTDLTARLASSMADAVEENVKPKTEEKPDDSGSEEDNSQPEVAEIEVALKTFKDLGVTEVLCEACRDIIGLAETGSGKTGAFALPILQSLLSSPQRLHTLVLTPTRELAFQIAEHRHSRRNRYDVPVSVLAKKPHIVIATPGRLIDHMENTKGFSLRALKFLVMDEADRILNMDFETEVDKILKVIPRERHTYLFSATMTKKVQKLQRAALKDPVKCAVSTKYSTVDKLQQYYIFIPSKYKDCYLVSILNELAGNSFMIFCSTCNNAQRFKSKSRSVLLATDVASRGNEGARREKETAERRRPGQRRHRTSQWSEEKVRGGRGGDGGGGRGRGGGGRGGGGGGGDGGGSMKKRGAAAWRGGAAEASYINRL